MRVERHHEALAKVLTILRSHLVRESGTTLSPSLEQLRKQMYTNRLLLQNGLAVSDHFAASLASSPGATSVLLSEQV